MAEKYTKKAVPDSSDWKDVQIEKEFTPPKQKSTVTYKQLEQQVANIDSQIASLGSQKAEVESEMAKVKKAVES